MFALCGPFQAPCNSCATSGGEGLRFYIGNRWDKFIASIVLCTRVCKMTEYKVKVSPGFLFCFHFQVPFLGLDNCPSVTLMVALH